MNTVNKIQSYFKSTKSKTHVFLLLLAISTIFRLPTLFNDYYDVDELSAIVQTWQWMNNETPGIDFHESKLPIYHAIFKLSYSISREHGWQIVHILTILTISLTSFFIYLICLKLNKNKASLIAGILYSILISCFNRMFMATNGEIIFNLPVIAGTFFFINIFNSKLKLQKTYSLILFLAFGYIASQIKFHGNILFVSTIFFILIIYPYINNRLNKKYLLTLLGCLIFILTLVLLDYTTNNFIASKLYNNIYSKLFYAIVDKGINPLNILVRYIHKQGLLLIWHFILWMPVFIQLKIYLKKRTIKNHLNISIIIITFFFTYLIIFSGGARLYFHYFMASYPPACIISAIALTDENNNRILNFIKKRLLFFILIPGLFFLVWNTKDIIIKNYYPKLFTHESKYTFWTRAVLIGSWDHYLLPHKSYNGVTNYIKENSNTSDKIAVWGDGPYIYYFSRRLPAVYHMWLKNTALAINLEYSKNTQHSIKLAKKMEHDILYHIKKNKPLFFIDTSRCEKLNFNFKIPPVISEYIKNEYKHIKTLKDIKIYRRK